MRIPFIIIILTLLSCKSHNYTSSPPLLRFQDEILTRVNKLRTSGCTCGNTYMPPVQPLTWNNMLADAASKHAIDMERHKYLSHTSKSGKTIKNRIEESGYTLSGLRTYAIGENIAAGQSSVEKVMQSWLKSEGHCKNIMNKTFKEIGAAKTRLYWVQDFGMRVAKK